MFIRCVCHACGYDVFSQTFPHFGRQDRAHARAFRVDGVRSERERAEKTREAEAGKAGPVAYSNEHARAFRVDGVCSECERAEKTREAEAGKAGPVAYSNETVGISGDESGDLV
jgi:hypothetical protein